MRRSCQIWSLLAFTPAERARFSAIERPSWPISPAFVTSHSRPLPPPTAIQVVSPQWFTRKPSASVPGADAHSVIQQTQFPSALLEVLRLPSSSHETSPLLSTHLETTTPQRAPLTRPQSLQGPHSCLGRYSASLNIVFSSPRTQRVPIAAKPTDFREKVHIERHYDFCYVALLPMKSLP
ncbi:hypothetical protein HDK77DRAFT_14300 [Phyllosticta capitalensis]